MLEIIFVDDATGKVNWGVTNVALVNYITPSEVGYTLGNGRKSSSSFLQTEKVEVNHIHGDA